MSLWSLCHALTYTYFITRQHCTAMLGYPITSERKCFDLLNDLCPHMAFGLYKNDSMNTRTYSEYSVYMKSLCGLFPLKKIRIQDNIIADITPAQ